MARPLVRSALLLLFAPAALAAQVIPLKTVPIPSGEQFLLFPTSNLGMADVSVAVDDRDGDPFGNPARGALLEGLRVHIAPTVYGETRDAVGGRTLPLALTMGNGRQFGTLMIGLQQLDGLRSRGWVPVEDQNSNFGGSTLNTYLQAGLGFSMPDGRTSFGIAGFYANLNALDGVSQLYFRAVELEQDGRLAEVRVGAMRDFGEGRMLDAVALLRDLDMTHRQTIGVWAAPDTAPWEGSWTTWQETGHDRTTTRSGQLRYAMPAGPMTRIGLSLGGSWKSHPKIPEYDLNFPRDPGTSRAFSVGAGLSEQRGAALFSIEALFEPAWSHTWALSDSVLTNPDGVVIGLGDKTVDNRFQFANWSLAGGFGYVREGVDFQFGLRVRAIQYDLEQQNFVTASTREVEEGWLEWSPSWGAIWNLDDIELRYSGRWISKGNPSPSCGGWFGGCEDFASPGDGSGGGDIDYLVAPDGAVSMPDYRVTTHRFSISVPIGSGSREPIAESP